MSDDEIKCNPHPRAPHGFLRNESHTQDRYVCECEFWDPWEDGYKEGYMKGYEEGRDSLLNTD